MLIPRSTRANDVCPELPPHPLESSLADAAVTGAQRHETTSTARVLPFQLNRNAGCSSGPTGSS